MAPPIFRTKKKHRNDTSSWVGWEPSEPFKGIQEELRKLRKRLAKI